MEYKVNETGKIVWYKLVGDSEIPIQVSVDIGAHAFQFRNWKYSCMVRHLPLIQVL